MRLTDYVYGRPQNFRDWLSNRVCEVFLGDSFYYYESTGSAQPGVRVRMMPKRFCGGFAEAGTFDPWVDFGFGTTGVRGGFTSASGYNPNNTYPFKVFESKFNGNAVGGNHYVYYGHNGTQPFTAARTAAGGTSWGDKWDWLRGRKGILHTYLIGSGNDHPACRAVMRGDPSGTIYAESANLPTAALGQLIHVQTPFDCSALSAEDVLTGLWIPAPYTAPAANSFRIFLGQTVEVGEDDAEPDPTPGYVYYNLGIFGTTLANWQDATKVNQDSLWDWITASGCTDLVIDFGINEFYLATISSVAQFRAQLEALRTRARQARPGIRIRYETPHCNNVAGDTIVGYCRDAGIQMAQAYDDFNVLDLHQYVKDEWGANRLLAYAVNPGVDNDHLTEPGRVLTTRLRMQMLMASAASLSDVNISTGHGPTPVDHNGGAAVTVDGGASAADILRYQEQAGTPGVGANGLTVTAYLKSESDAGVWASKGETTTGNVDGVAGRWLAPINLFPGEYVIIADRPGDSFSAKRNVIVVT